MGKLTRQDTRDPYRLLRWKIAQELEEKRRRKEEEEKILEEIKKSYPPTTESRPCTLTVTKENSDKEKK